ncbi:MAG: hypothetical protein JNM10_12135 [Planctomycetia bacterium]|nr:hypothetical protein [Planctomycetia bacterium]
MRRAAVPLAFLLACAAPAGGADAPAPAAPPPAVVAGDVAEDTTWTGTVVLDRRVRVAEGATLRIARGTRVVVPWAAQHAAGAARPGLEVLGGLDAAGDTAAPIRFEPEARPPGERERRGRAWLGIVVFPGSSRPVRLSHVLVADADAGLQPGRGDVAVTDCAFHGCDSGVGVGVLWDGRDRVIRTLRDVAPRLEGCRFGACHVGVTVELEARPALVRCVFHRCHAGVANQRTGNVYPMTGLGPFVERCEFLGCGTAVQGASRVTHSIFEGNGLVFAGSSFGERLDALVDRFVRGRNLFGENKQLVRSDVPVGDDATFATPRRRGALPDVLGPDDLLGPLDVHLGLAPGSPGLGAAADGGDLGAFGADGATRGRAGLASPTPGLGVPRLLALGPPSPGLLDALPALAADVAKRARVAGDVEGDASWAVVEATELEDDEASRRAAATSPGTRVLLATFTAAEAGRASLRIAWDGTLEAWWDGEPVATPARARRFEPDDVIKRVNVRKGANALLLRHTPRATTGRLVVRLRAVEGDGAPAGIEAAAVVRPGGAAARAAVTGATLTREKGRDGKPTGRAVLRIALAGPVHWREVGDRARYRLLDAKGEAFDLAAAPLHYRPAEKALVFTLPAAPPSGAWRLVVDGLRRPDGSAFPEPGVTVALRGP